MAIGGPNLLRQRWLLVGLVVLAGQVGCGNREGGGGPAGGPPVPAVTVGTPVKRTLVEWDEYTGRLDAVDFVEVRSRVSGYLVEAPFEEGGVVAQGDLLLVIDKRPYEATVQRAEADLAEARAKAMEARSAVVQSEAQQRAAAARLDLADKQLARMETLLPSRAVSQDQYDVQAAQRTEAIANNESAQSDIEAARAAVASADAMVETMAARLAEAQLELSYTEIRAPIAGRISRKMVTVGNYVSGGFENSSALTTIASMDPMHCNFDADEQSYLKYMRLAKSGQRRSARESKTAVYMALADERDGYPHRGYIDFVDNRLDPNTGTMRGRAVFANAEGLLTPGLFVRLQLPGSGEYEAVLIPDRAIGVDQSETYVFVLGADNKLERRKIEMGPTRYGLRIVRSGLDGTEKVVLGGLQRVRTGMVVKPTEEPVVTQESDGLPDRAESVSAPAATTPPTPTN